MKKLLSFMFACLILVSTTPKITAQEQEPTPSIRYLFLTLETQNGDPIQGQEIQARFINPLQMIPCETDENGACTIELESDEDIISGQLMIVGRGIRPVTWQGESLTLPLAVDAQGLITIPLDFLPTIAKKTVVVETPVNETTPTPPIETVEPTATEQPKPSPEMTQEQESRESIEREGGEETADISSNESGELNDRLPAERPPWWAFLVLLLCVGAVGLVPFLMYVGLWTSVWSIVYPSPKGERGEKEDKRDG